MIRHCNKCNNVNYCITLDKLCVCNKCGRVFPIEDTWMIKLKEDGTYTFVETVTNGVVNE